MVESLSALPSSSSSLWISLGLGSLRRWLPTGEPSKPRGSCFAVQLQRPCALSPVRPTPPPPSWSPICASVPSTVSRPKCSPTMGQSFGPTPVNRSSASQTLRKRHARKVWSGSCQQRPAPEEVDRLKLQSAWSSFMCQHICTLFSTGGKLWISHLFPLKRMLVVAFSHIVAPFTQL